jgi:hypothetical protein
MGERIADLLIRAVRACSLSGSISLSFMFLHRTVLQKGGAGAGPWIVHEDMYGRILFALFALALLAFPLPESKPYLWAVVRSLLLTAGTVLCIAIIGLAYRSDGFHLENFLIIIGVAIFGSFLLGSSCFWRLPCEERA